MAIILSLLCLVLGCLDGSKKLLHQDLLVGQLLPLLQELFLQAVHLMSLAGKLRSGTAIRLIII